MKLVLDLQKIQTSWFDIKEFKKFVEKLVERLNEHFQVQPELFAVLRMEDEMEEYFCAMENILPRNRIKTICFYPEIEEDSWQDINILKLFNCWFFSQFNADYIYRADYGDIFLDSETWFKTCFEKPSAISLDELIKSLFPLVRCRSDKYLSELAFSIEDSKLFLSQKLFVDMSQTVLLDFVTGIQRAVKGFYVGLKKILQTKTDTLCIPVYSGPEKKCFFIADENNSGYTPSKYEDGSTTVQFHDGDILFFPDLFLDNTVNKAKYIKKLKYRGICVITYLHDLFPLYYPEQYAEEKIVEKFTDFLKAISTFSGVIANSKTTLNNYLCWLTDSEIRQPAYFLSDFVYLGNDIEKTNPTTGIPWNAREIVEIMNSRTTLLMVGSIEPRKNHELVLDAVELLWEKNIDVNLFFVGKYGWRMEKFAGRLASHPQRNKKFFWLNDVSDEFLDVIYKNSDGVIYVSIDEGYGIPIIEASKYNKPLLLRNIQIFREVAGDNAAYFNGSQDSFLLADTIQKWIEDIKNKCAFSSNKIKAYSWDECSEKLLKLLKKAQIGVYDDLQ